jgi:hypothetical protein
VVHPELYPEFERTLNKRVQKGYKDGYKEDAETGTFGLQRYNSGTVPVQFRIHDKIHIEDTSGYISGSSRKTRYSSGTVPVPVPAISEYLGSIFAFNIFLCQDRGF